MTQAVVLHNKDAFQKILANYQVSEHAKGLLKNINMVGMGGLAGGGRNTVINYLVNNANYHFIVSDTTRPPKLRNGAMEVDGVSYHFRREEDMLHEIQAGEFLEAEIIHNQQVSGVSIRELVNAHETGKIPIHDFEFGGLENIHTAKPDAHIIGLLPPSYDEWIRRFKEREEISEQELLNRLRTAKEVLTRMLEKPYFKLVINDSIEQCATDVRKIVENGQYTSETAERCRGVAQDILSRVNTRLAQQP
jgi:guanylate kinase